MTLVSILGDFHSSILPITYEFKEKITKHIIVYDDAKQDIKESWRMIRGQKAFHDSLPKNSNFDYELVTMKIDEDSYESIEECFHGIKTLIEDPKELYLNATDGLSSISVVLSSNTLSSGGKVIAYDRYANTYNIHTQNSMKKYLINNNMDIQSHLMLKGYTLLDVTGKQELQQRKSVIMELAEHLDNYKKFANLLQQNKANNIQGYQRYKSLLHDIDALDNIAFVQGTVFEEYIYHLIVDNFDFDDVWTGVKVLFEEEVENEFDILMIKDNHLHTIECKLVSGLNGEHFVYKTELIMDYLDDDGKAMILSVGADNVRITKSGNRRTQFTRGDKARADYGDIKIHQTRIFSEKEFLNDVREWFL